jgi:hypothetical protein
MFFDLFNLYVDNCSDVSEVHAVFIYRISGRMEAVCISKTR